MAKYLKGKFTPKNPEKYAGDVNNIIYRSSWEKFALIKFDESPSILRYSSEEVVIPYLSPVDNRVHRYFVDFAIKYKTRDGSIKNALIEIKPLAQCSPPAAKKRQTKRYLTEVSTYLVNDSKWAAARAWCAENNFEFIIFSEKELFGK